MPETLDIKVEKISQSRRDQVDFDNLIFGRVFSDHMLVADYQDQHWAQTQISPYGKIALDPALMALHYGQSIFEGLKAFRSEKGEILLFRPEENLKRMNRSARRMCMPEVPEEIFLGGMKQLLELDQTWVPQQEGSSLYIRPFMFASDEYIGLKPSDNYKFIIFTSPVAAYYSEPVKVKIEQDYVRACQGGIGEAKTAGNYAASMYPARLAQNAGYHQLIWTDAKEHRYIEESGTMNLVFKIKGKIISPKLEGTILPGITRMSILQLARDWGFEVEERPVSVDEIIEAIQKGELEEAFGVGTAATVSPISLIAFQGEDHTLPAMQADGFGLKAKQYLMDLCRGRVEDTHHWITKV